MENDDLRDEKGYNTTEYILDVLPRFDEDDGVPMTLKALLYNRHTHWTGGYGVENDVKNFKSWYREQYLEQD